MSQTALVAIGGNSLIADKNRPDIPRQWEAVRETCSILADLIQDGWRIIITHGNGPQVGFILSRNELAADKVHTTPLDIIVADTQGSIGYMLQQTLRNQLFARGVRRPVATVVTQVLVDRDDPAFKMPTKPIGGFLTAEAAQKYRDDGWQVIEDAGRGFRRVVASPKPIDVIEETTIRYLVQVGVTVVAAGGGGIPVTRDDSGFLRELKGEEAVIDKDWVSGLLARQMDVDLFLISTGVEKVAINFNTPEQVDLDKVSLAEMRQYYAEDHFAAGSMKPKIEAVMEFVELTGKKAIITDPSNIKRAIQGETGTWVVPQ
ncbi:MAG: carbamate kinase [Anaerolineales bacterium]|nr:carbamate kinase [Anaerolineales bacterium]